MLARFFLATVKRIRKTPAELIKKKLTPLIFTFYPRQLGAGPVYHQVRSLGRRRQAVHTMVPRPMCWPHNSQGKMTSTEFFFGVSVFFFHRCHRPAAPNRWKTICFICPKEVGRKMSSRKNGKRLRKNGKKHQKKRQTAQEK